MTSETSSLEATRFDAAIATALLEAGFGNADRQKFDQDASTRSYERVRDGGRTAILMKAQPGNEDGPCPPDADEETRRALGWNALSRLAASRVEAFVAIGDHLRGHGFSAPANLAVNAPVGVAVVEDLGDDLYARVIAEGRANEVELYRMAGEALAALHQTPIPSTLPSPIGPWPILDFDAIALRENANLFVDWTPRFLGLDGFSVDARAEWSDIRDSLIGDILAHRRAFTLRDYHAENILWLPEREGIARVGLLDFQDAVHGYRAWDFAMLLHDARRDVSAEAYEATIRAYLDATGSERVPFDEELAIQGAINALRILGIFSRLVGRDGKQRYRLFMPREAGHLAQVLTHPRLKALQNWVERYVPLEAFKQAQVG
jgi:aminoglycoside/choline kinase family phosphotransferase